MLSAVSWERRLQSRASVHLAHTDISITPTTNTHRERKCLTSSFRGRLETRLEPTDADHRRCDVFFLCLPHGTAAAKAKELFYGRALIVDLSADFRFEDISIYERHYVEHQAK
jgi:N-acetyl-gamma-glutamyl-phosphate reductase